MRISFPKSNLVFGTVVSVPSSRFFFVKNGEPAHIMCHVSQGGTLMATPAGNLFLDQNSVELPAVNTPVVLVRESTNQADKAYAKAFRWAHAGDWQYVKWAVHAQTTFRAIGYEHRTNGRLQKDSKRLSVLDEGTLAGLVGKYGGHDPFGDKHFSRLSKGIEFSCRVLWQRLDGDGVWTHCGCPMPLPKN